MELFAIITVRVTDPLKLSLPRILAEMSQNQILSSRAESGGWPNSWIENYSVDTW